MSKHDSHQPAHPEATDGAKPTDASLQGADNRAPAGGWQGYSPETMAALLDELPAAW
jgi:hypothetical protein